MSKRREGRMLAGAFAAVLAAGIFLFSGEAYGERAEPGEGLRRREGIQSERAREFARRRLEEIEVTREKIAQRMRREREMVREALSGYREAETDEEKEAAEADLRSILEESFDRRYDLLKERLEELREKCLKIEDKIAEHSEKKEEIIEKRLERLLEIPDRPENRKRRMFRGE